MPPRRQAIVLAALLAGCGAVPIHELRREGELDITLDANARDHLPRRRTKFFVEITNRTARPLDPALLSIELLAAPAEAPDVVSLREEWRYRWPAAAPAVQPGKKLILPIVPERSDTLCEFCLELLAPGPYTITAVVNGRHRSAPYILHVVRPDIALLGGDAAGSGDAP